MTLHELESPEALQAFYTKHKNAIICFSATWCGPCQKSKPALTEMANKYSNDFTKDVKFGIVYEHNLSDSIHTYKVKAFPTYVLFVSGAENQRVEGVNLDGIESMIQNAGCEADLSTGQSLGGSGNSTALSAEEARAQRLAKLGGSSAAAAPAASPSSAPFDMETESTTNNDNTESDGKDASKEDVDMADASKTDTCTMVDPTANLDKEAITMLTESMRFPLLRAQKGLLNGGGNVEGAIEWLTAHQDDDDIDDPIPPTSSSGGVAQSYKCNDCGKILSNMANLELHANKTGHSDFEESTEKVKPLTAEEKAAKIAEIKALLKAKRDERESAEKDDEKEREKQRRFMGKEMAKTREEMEREKMKRDAQLRKREKQAAKLERERIRAELEKDKRERQANKGKLSSKLGVDGYNPDGIQYDMKVDGAETSEDQQAARKKHKSKASAAKIDEYITKVSSYRAGGDGGKCMKLLLLFISNVVDNPDEPKFKSIKTEGKAYKTKIKPFIGGKSLLLAVGFNPNDAGDALVLSDDADTQLLADTKAKLEAAYEKYNS